MQKTQFDKAQFILLQETRDTTGLTFMDYIFQRKTTAMCRYLEVPLTFRYTNGVMLERYHGPDYVLVLQIFGTLEKRETGEWGKATTLYMSTNKED